MRAIICVVLLSVMLFACNENEYMAYTGKSGVYFTKYKNTDTIKYSFHMTPDDKDTLLIDVKLMGKPVIGEQSYQLEIDSRSTAKEGIHYEKIPEFVVFPEHEVEMRLPIVLCDKDPSLDSHSDFLCVKLVSSSDLELGFPNNTILNIEISNQLIKPSYWNKNFIIWFGEYSKVKHEKCIEIMGHDFPLTYEEAAYWNSDKVNLYYWMFVGRKVADYFVKHPTEDEFGNMIDPWEPA